MFLFQNHPWQPFICNPLGRVEFQITKFFPIFPFIWLVDYFLIKQMNSFHQVSVTSWIYSSWTSWLFYFHWRSIESRTFQSRCHDIAFRLLFQPRDMIFSYLRFLFYLSLTSPFVLFFCLLLQSKFCWKRITATGHECLQGVGGLDSFQLRFPN